MTRYITYSFLIFFCYFFIACAPTVVTSKTSRGKNLADIYNPSKLTLHPDFSIVHLNDSLTVLYVRVFTSELLFSDANQLSVLRAKIRIYYEIERLGSKTSSPGIIDSASVIKNIDKADSRNSYVVGMPLKTPSGYNYSIAIDVGDLLRNTSTRSYRNMNKTSKYSDQNFNVLSAATNYPTFTNIFAKGEFFKIHFNQIGYDTVFVDYFSLDRSLPRPVFSATAELPLKEYPDTSYLYPFTDTTVYELPKAGIYKIRVNPDSAGGLTLFNFGENFPRVKSPDDLLGPLVYLTTSAEFRDLRIEQNRKLAVDNFWLTINPDMQSSKELIRVYYNRVLYANLYFSSYKEGWKTDRGMIYIIFGPPRMLEKGNDFEKWSYYSRKSGQQVQFDFLRKGNKFTDYDFQLERNIESNSAWREAVQSWRRGEIYTISP